MSIAKLRINSIWLVLFFSVLLFPAFHGEAQSDTATPTPIVVPTPGEPTIVVNTLLDDPRGCPDRCTLRHAIMTAKSGDIIGFDATLSGSIVLAQPLTLDKDLTIVGLGADKLVLDGGGKIGLLSVSSGMNVTLFNMTFSNGLTVGSGNSFVEAGAIRNSGNLTLVGVVVTNNTQGGGVYNDGTLTIEKSTFSNNINLYGGAGAISNGNILTVVDSTFSENKGRGGAILNDGAMTINNTVFSRNVGIGSDIPGPGGAITNRANMTISDSIFTANTSEFFAGAISTSGLGSTLIRCQFEANTAQFGGGGIANFGELTVIDSVFSNNRALGDLGNGEGGGIQNDQYAGGILSVSGSTFVNNQVKGSGGAVSVRGGKSIITNSTLANNIATEQGGGVMIEGELTLIGVTIAGNSAQIGGGIANASTLNLGSSIVANNTAPTGSDINGLVTSLTGNLIGNIQDSSGWFASDLQNVDPLLGSLADNGGLTETMGLLAGSPAIGMGYCEGDAAITIDQRGTPRKTPCDVGAFETDETGGLPSESIAQASTTQSSNGRGQIVFISASTDENYQQKYSISIMGADGSNAYQLLESVGSPFGTGELQFPVWSPDSSQIAFLQGDSNNGYSIYTVNSDGTNQHLVAENVGYYSLGLSWSPDVTQLAYSSYGDTNGNGSYKIFIVNLSGTDPKNLSGSSDNEYHPVWSPDGHKIAYSHEPQGCQCSDQRDIYVMNADGTGITQLTDNQVVDSGPSWSPDGSKIAFRSERDGVSDIYVMNADGSNQQRLTNSIFGNYVPAWSPDGSQIVFECRQDGAVESTEICTINVDGSNLVRLTNNTYFDGQPKWGQSH